MTVFISVVVASIRPENIVDLLENLDATVGQPDDIEVLIKLKEGDADTLASVEEWKASSRFAVKYIASPERDGYYSLNEGYDELFSVADPDSYFFWLLNDEVRIKTENWDSVLKDFVGFFPDDAFRLKLSVFKLKNYYDVYECFPCPDNYALTTRAWLDITGGWGEFWGGDAWHQAVEYYLGAVRGGYGDAGCHRGVPVYGVELENEEAGQGIEGDARRERDWRVARGWQKCYSKRSREKLNGLAHRLYGHILAAEQGISDYELEDDPIRRRVTVRGATDETVVSLSYRLSLARMVARYVRHRYPLLASLKREVHLWIHKNARPLRYVRRAYLWTARRMPEVLTRGIYLATFRSLNAEVRRKRSALRIRKGKVTFGAEGDDIS